MANLQVFPNFILTELPEIDSTNLYTENLLLKEDVPEGSVFYTFNQKRGIGQADNKWESEPFKNLTATIVLKPVFLEASSQFLLTTVLSLSVCEVLLEYLPDSNPMIKWPNDIYCNHRKIAGILIKNHIMGKNISKTIAGLGLNVNQTNFSHAPMATSLKLLSGNEHDIKKILTKWHYILSEYYNLLKTDKKALLNQYLSKLYLKDQFSEYFIKGKMVIAAISGIDRHGQLVLFDEVGKKYVCGLKEVVFPFNG
jgi:BirA family transcriptional regulator, biotin operon repressor / biotin---[acetyl-CoA-carboxylase] ligase